MTVSGRGDDGSSAVPVSPDEVRRSRAQAVLTSLTDLWGDALPPGSDPVVTVLVDAVASDDWFGRSRGLVVQGDGIAVSAVVDLFSGRPGTPAEIAANVPADPSPLSHAGAWDIDLVTGLATWDEQCGWWIGRGAAAGSGSADAVFREQIHPDDLDTVRRAIAGAERDGVPFSIRYRNRQPDGSWVWVRSHGRVLDANGRPRVIGFLVGERPLEVPLAS